jgi:DNA polymerase type B, organellar and viral
LPDKLQQINQHGGGLTSIPTTLTEHACYTEENPKCRARTNTHYIQLNPPAQDEEPFTHTHRFFRDLVETLKKGTKDSDYITVNVTNLNDLGYEVDVEAMRAKDFDHETIIQTINKASQSNATFSSAGMLRIITNIVDTAEGSGGQAAENKQIWNVYKCVITPRNNNGYHRALQHLPTTQDIKGFHHTERFNNYCGVYAAHIGMMHRRYMRYKSAALKREYEEGLKQRSRGFAARIDDIMDLLEIDLSDRGMCRDDWVKMQEAYPEYHFRVHCGPDRSNLIFDGARKNAEFGIVTIILDNGHYLYCKVPGSLFNYKNLCEDCGRTYSHKDAHFCVKICYACGCNSCKNENIVPNAVSCIKCKGSFKNFTCFRHHLSPGLRQQMAKCLAYEKCKLCGYMISSNVIGRRKHTCGEYFCRNCQKMVGKGHDCYIKVEKQATNGLVAKSFITVFDIESTQWQEKEENKFVHEPNVICALTTCHKCWGKDDLKDCDFCGEREMTFENMGREGADLADEFLEYAYRKARGFTKGTKCRRERNHYLVSHYGQGYDSHFIAAAAIASEKYSVDILIQRGTKILKAAITRGCVTIILVDFFNFVSQGLASMCKSFALDGDLCKGSFPHMFNRPENYDYEADVLPPMENWCPDSMKIEAREKFLEWWHETNADLKEKNEKWNFKKEIISYCRTDVKILHRAMRAFCADMEKTGVHPILETMTIASLCMKIFLKNFMPPKTIGKYIFIHFAVKQFYFSNRYNSAKRVPFERHAKC